MSISVDGGILAGGLSTRMEGQDKGLQIYHNQPMVASVAATLAPYVDKLIINCNRNEDQYQAFGDQICSDLIDGYKGPLAGLHSILSASQADYVLISPCDTPNIKSIFCQRMLEQLNNSQTDKPELFAVQTENKSHPLHLLIHTSFKESLSNSLKQGHFKAMRWLEENDVTWLDFSDDSASFKNINTLEELKV